MTPSSATSPLRALACVAALAVGASSSPALAQTAQDTLTQLEASAEPSERVETRARALLEDGGLAPAQLARVQRLLGLAAARRGDDDAARAALLRWLAIDPSGRLDSTASDALRSVFMEARGVARAHPLTVAATWSDEALVVRVDDEEHLAARVRVRVRDRGDTRFEDTTLVASAEVRVPHRGRPVDYTVTLLDEFGNRLLERGTEAAPEHLAPPVAAAAAGPVAAVVDRTPFDVAAVVLGAAGVAGLGVGVALHAARESEAGTWNGASCVSVTQSRGELCGDVDARRSADETGAILGYALGGALAISALVIELVAPSASPPSATALACDPAGLGVRCAGTF